MKAAFNGLLLAIGMTCSLYTWSFGTQIDLGNIVLMPGVTLLPIKDTPIYSGINYKFACRINAVSEPSALKINQIELPGLCIEYNGELHMPGEIMKFESNTEMQFVIHNVTYNTHTFNATIKFQNLDQNQSLTLHCVADLA